MSSAILRVAATRNDTGRTPRSQKKPNTLFHITVRSANSAQRAPANRRSDFYSPAACPKIIVNPQRDSRAINQFLKSK